MNQNRIIDGLPHDRDGVLLRKYTRRFLDGDDDALRYMLKAVSKTKRKLS